MTATVGHMFPAHDVVARWMFSLTVLVDDLAVFENRMRSALNEGDALEPSTAYFRIILVRIYEGERIVRAIDGHRPVAKFVAGIGADDEVQALRDAYAKQGDDESEVERVLGDSRHRSVHYSKVGSRELQDALAKAADLPARMALDHERRVMRYLWPRDVLDRDLWPDPVNDPALRLTHQLSQAFLVLHGKALTAYVQRRNLTLDDVEVVDLTPDS